MADLNLKVPAIEKLIDYGATGVGAIAGPLLSPWKASREGKAKLIAAETDAKVREIHARTDAHALKIIAEAQSEARAYLPSDSDVHGTLDITREGIAQSIEFQGRKRLANARAVLEAAADELGDKEVNDHDPDPDWTARFFGYVQDVSAEDMQKIWAKILAGEVESPGRTSLRTLDTLRNMIMREAAMFRDICDHIILEDALFYDDSVKHLVSLKYSNFLHLQDCGLITTTQNLVKEIRWHLAEEIVYMLSVDAILVKRNPGAATPLKVPEIKLTAAGLELFQITQCRPNMAYLQAFAKFLNSQGGELFYLEGVVQLPDGRKRYAKRTFIEPNPNQAEGTTP